MNEEMLSDGEETNTLDDGSNDSVDSVSDREYLLSGNDAGTVEGEVQETSALTIKDIDLNSNVFLGMGVCGAGCLFQVAVIALLRMLRSM